MDSLVDREDISAKSVVVDCCWPPPPDPPSDIAPSPARPINPPPGEEIDEDEEREEERDQASKEGVVVVVVATLVAGEACAAEVAFIIMSGKLSRGRLPLRCLKLSRPFEGTTLAVATPTALPPPSPPSNASFG